MVNSMCISNDGSVYLAGGFSTDNDVFACYWKNGAKVDLGTQGIAESIFVLGSKVFIAGNRDDGGTTMPVCWVDGARTDLPAEGSSAQAFAMSICASESRVYVAGRWSGKPCLWTNGVREELAAASGGGTATSVCLSNDHVYVAGISGNSACSWVDGSRIDLEVPGAAYHSSGAGICVAGDKVYVAGSRFTPAGTTLPCYWVDQTRVDLPVSFSEPAWGKAETATSICVSNGTVYAVGYSTETLSFCCWVDGVRTDLVSDGFVDNHRATIAVSGSDVYVAGWDTRGPRNSACAWDGEALADLPGQTSFGDTLANSVSLYQDDLYVAGWCAGRKQRLACYWKNGHRTDLSDGTHPAVANSICVADGMVYVAGDYSSDGVSHTACYWRNGVRIDLPGNQAAASSICVSGGSVYVAGRFSRESGGTVPCYWKDGQLYDLGEQGTGVTLGATAISMVDGILYIAGDFATGTNVSACYWVDGQRSMLDGIVANALFVQDGIVYTAGSCLDPAGGSPNACSWKGSSRSVLSNGEATSIVISNGNVYVGGYRCGDKARIACCWINGLRTDLPDPSTRGAVVNSILVK